LFWLGCDGVVDMHHVPKADCLNLVGRYEYNSMAQRAITLPLGGIAIWQ
jgi:hypothetical protein